MNFTNNSKKIKHRNPIKSLFQVENFLNDISKIKNSHCFVKSAQKILNKKFTNPH